MGGDPTRAPLQFVLNGTSVRVSEWGPHTTLLDFVRSRGLTAAKEGCAEGECGACTVLLVRPCGSGSAYVPVNSCLMFLPMAAGQEIVTVEAFAENGRLAPAQEAMAAAGGSQCGYCTPGFVASLFAEHYRPGREGGCDVEALSGNLCRCTGYRPIRDAALSLGKAPGGALAERLRSPATCIEAVDADGFHRPATLPEYFEVAARHPGSTVIAGGTDLAVESNLRGRRFEKMISLEGLQELRVFREADDEVEIGAGLTLAEIDARWEQAPAVWKEWIRLFASPLIRNRATLGGNLATASPIGDAAPLLMAFDARVKVGGAGGVREMPLTRFFTGYRKTALASGELIVSVVLSPPPSGIRTVGSGVRFFKVAKRRTDDISTVAACFAIDLDRRGIVRKARLAYGGVAPAPVRALEAEETLNGVTWNEFAIHRAQDVLARTLHPISDHRGSADYRLAVAQNLLEKFWWEQQASEAA